MKKTKTISEKRASVLQTFLQTKSVNNRYVTIHLSNNEVVYLIRCLAHCSDIAKEHGWYDNDSNSQE